MKHTIEAPTEQTAERYFDPIAFDLRSTPDKLIVGGNCYVLAATQDNELPALYSVPMGLDDVPDFGSWAVIDMDALEEDQRPAVEAAHAALTLVFNAMAPTRKAEAEADFQNQLADAAERRLSYTR
jgi:hypothetical protein